MSTTVRHHLNVRLPGSRTRAISAFALFAAVQMADALMTASGIQRFGVRIEANPLLAAYIGLVGPIGAIGSAKLVALFGAAILHLRAQFLVLALLTDICVFAALVPWAVTLALS